MKIRRISLSKDTLLKMEPADRAFLLLAGHIQNELNSVQKVFAFCLHNGRTKLGSPIEGLANGMQAMIFARMLAGKLWEAQQVVHKAFFNTPLGPRVKSKLQPVAQQSLKKITKYFAKKGNTIQRVRQSFAFHYSPDQFGRNWEAVADEPFFELIAGGTVGNNLHLASEMVANAALLNALNPKGREVALGEFFNEIQSVASDFTNFLEGTIIAILEEHFGTDLSALGREEEISPALSHSEVAIPFFYKPDVST